MTRGERGSCDLLSSFFDLEFVVLLTATFSLTSTRGKKERKTKRLAIKKLKKGLRSSASVARLFALSFPPCALYSIFEIEISTTPEKREELNS